MQCHESFTNRRSPSPRRVSGPTGLLPDPPDENKLDEYEIWDFTQTQAPAGNMVIFIPRDVGEWQKYDIAGGLFINVK